MSTVIRVVILCGFFLGSSTCQIFAAAQGGSGPLLGSHYERPRTDADSFKERVIVFVHGIFGDANSSWTSDRGAYWPKLLLKDSAFNDSDVYVAQYESPAQGNTLSVTEVVAQLNSRLTSDAVFEKHHEVVFVCHSLGGIIVQQLLLTFREHAKQVPFIYLFAVPEEGSQVARLGSFFNSDPLLKALFNGDENEYLLNLENQWRAAHFTIKLYCAYEKKPVKGTILIVGRLSGTRNCYEPPIPINEDHMGIVKPNGMKHDSYIALRNATVANPVSHKPPVGHPRKKTEVSSAPPLPAPPFITMQISPSSLPIYVRSRSVTSVLQLHPFIGLTASQDGLLKIANDTGNEGCWPSKEAMDSQGPGGHETLYHIEIGNHSQRTIAGGKVKFGLKYNSGVKGGGCTPPSGGQHDQEDIVLIPPLDPGKSFEFYAVNQSDRCVWLIPPDSATVTMAGEDQERQVAFTFDKSPLYVAGAPCFPSTTIEWEGVPIKPGGYGIVRTGARSCEGAPQSQSSSKDPLGKTASTQKNEVAAGTIQQARPSPASPIDTDIHGRLVSDRLALGWTLHKRGNSWTVSLLMDTDQLGPALISAIDRGDLRLDEEPSTRARTLWSEIRLKVPPPKPAETEYGIVKDQEFVEHITHYFGREPDGLQWTYEIMQNGSGITPQPQVLREIWIGGLSSGGRETVSEMDKLALRNVNRRYVDAIVKISK
jgi:hypothetical protein